MALTFFLSSLYSNGLDVLLKNRDYLWYKSFSVIVHREKYDAKGILYSGCQTQLPLAVTSATCMTAAFPGAGLYCCVERSLRHPSHHHSTLAYLLFSLNNFPSKKVETFHCLSLTNRSFFNNRHKVFQN